MYNPYAKGRWHRFFIESTGTTYKLTDNEGFADVQITSNYLVFPVGFHILDSISDVNTSGGTATTAGNTSFVLRRMGDGSQGVTLPDKTHFDHMYMYVFGYFE